MFSINDHESNNDDVQYGANSADDDNDDDNDNDNDNDNGAAYQSGEPNQVQ